MTRYKLRPPARGLSGPAYPHLDLSNLPPKPGPSRVQRRNAAEAKLANEHYSEPHQPFVAGCPECAFDFSWAMWPLHAAWFRAPAIPKGFR